jgi:DNA polymerase-3 subunit gamma/tau
VATQALYLKWRPLAFDDFIGQEHVVRTLLGAIRQGRIRHAYLFSGPRGTGKTTTARLLAKAVNCIHPDINRHPCNECSYCLSVNEGRFLDVIEIDAASHTGVDDVRELRDKIAFAPSEGRYKVYIIDEVHRFSGAAFDALLKTLEEPPDHAIFILATTEIDKVPATIKSRCLPFEFRRFPLREVVGRLRQICQEEGISVDDRALELIARQGTGSMRDSISLLDQIVADPTEHISFELAQAILGAASSQYVIELAKAIISNDAAYGLEVINGAVDNGADPRYFGRQVIEYLRNLLLIQMGTPNLVAASDEMLQAMGEQAQMIGRTALLKAIRTFNSAVADLRGGWQPQLPLELALVESTKIVVEDEPMPVARRPESRPPSPSRPISKPPTPPSDSWDEPARPPEKKRQTGPLINTAQISAKWPSFLEVAHRNPRLKAFIEWWRGYRVEGTTLFLQTDNKMLRQKMEQADNLQLIEKAAHQVFGEGIQLRIELLDDPADRQGKRVPDNYADDELLMFGVNELGGEINLPDEE